MEVINSHVLCVEDNADNQLLLRMYVKKQPYQITFAEDGIVATDLLDNRQFDLFLIDLKLPNGMDGFEVARKIRQHSVHKDKPIVIISAFSKSDIEEPDDPPNINLYLTKPIRKVEFIEVLDQFLKS